MSHLTIEKKLVQKKGGDLKPVRGYDLVLYKNNRYDRIVPNGRKPNLGIQRHMNTYECFAVNRDRNLTLKFDQPIVHDDNVHEFRVDYEIVYHVSDPIQVVEKLDQDPLNRIKKQVKKVIGRYLSGARWQEIVDQNLFGELRERSLNDLSKAGRNNMEVNFDQIAEFALNYGIELEEVHFSRRISDKFIPVDVEVDETKAREKKRHELEEQRIKLAEALKKNQRDYSKNDALSESLDNAIRVVMEKFSHGVDNVEDLNETLVQLKETKRLIQSGVGTQQESINLISGEQQFALLGQGINPKLGKFLLDILLPIKSSNLNLDIQKELLSGLFHLIASELSISKGKDQELYIEKINSLSISDSLKKTIKGEVITLFTFIQNEKQTIL